MAIIAVSCSVVALVSALVLARIALQRIKRCEDIVGETMKKCDALDVKALEGKVSRLEERLNNAIDAAGKGEERIKSFCQEKVKMLDDGLQNRICAAEIRIKAIEFVQKEDSAKGVAASAEAPKEEVSTPDETPKSPDSSSQGSDRPAAQSAGIEDRDRWWYRDKLAEISKTICRKCRNIEYDRKVIRLLVASSVEDDYGDDKKLEESTQKKIEEYIWERVGVREYEGRYVVSISKDWDPSAADMIREAIKFACADNAKYHFGLLRENVQLEDGKHFDIYGFGVVNEATPTMMRLTPDLLLDFDPRISIASREVLEECVGELRRFCKGRHDKVGDVFLQIVDRRMVRKDAGRPGNIPVSEKQFASEIEGLLCMKRIAEVWPNKNVMDNVERRIAWISRQVI